VGLIAFVRAGALLIWMPVKGASGGERLSGLGPPLALLALTFALAVGAAPAHRYAAAAASSSPTLGAYAVEILGDVDAPTTRPFPGARTVIGRLVPHPVVSVLLFVTWLALVEEPRRRSSDRSPGDRRGRDRSSWLPGSSDEPVRSSRPLAGLRLAAVVILDIVVANVVVARLVLGPWRGCGQGS
jgi:hypothetical protein